jgi:hypothetical protein
MGRYNFMPVLKHIVGTCTAQKDRRPLGPPLIDKTPREKLLMDIVASPKLKKGTC